MIKCGNGFDTFSNNRQTALQVKGTSVGFNPDQCKPGSLQNPLEVFVFHKNLPVLYVLKKNLPK